MGDEGGKFYNLNQLNKSPTVSCRSEAKWGTGITGLVLLVRNRAAGQLSESAAIALLDQGANPFGNPDLNSS